MLLFTGCGKKSVSEKELVGKIEEIDDIYNLYPDLEMINYEVVSRKTDSKNGTDTIEIEVNADNSYLEYTCKYYMYYSKYDQGWELDDWWIMEEDAFIKDDYFNITDPQDVNSNYLPNLGIIEENLTYDVLDSFYYSTEIENIEIEDFHLDLRNGDLNIKCKICALGEETQVEGEYCVNYCANILEDNIWVYDGIEELEHNVTPICAGVRLQDAEFVFNNLYDSSVYDSIELTEEEVALSEGGQSFTWQVGYGNDFFTASKSITIFFNFNEYTGWQYVSDDAYEDYFSWNEEAFVGLWYTDMQWVPVKLEVRSFDSETRTMDCYCARGSNDLWDGIIVFDEDWKYSQNGVSVELKRTGGLILDDWVTKKA
jgi:hypothetical protein